MLSNRYNDDDNDDNYCEGRQMSHHEGPRSSDEKVLSRYNVQLDIGDGNMWSHFHISSPEDSTMNNNGE